MKVLFTDDLYSKLIIFPTCKFFPQNYVIEKFGSLLIIHHLFSPKFFMSQPFLYKVRSSGVLQVFLKAPRARFHAELGARLTFLGLSSPPSWGYSLHRGPVLKLLFPGVCSCCLGLLLGSGVFPACLPLLPEGTGEARGEELVTGMGSLGFWAVQLAHAWPLKSRQNFSFYLLFWWPSLLLVLGHRWKSLSCPWEGSCPSQFRSPGCAAASSQKFRVL